MAKGPTAKMRFLDGFLRCGALGRLSGSASKLAIVLYHHFDADGFWWLGDPRAAAEAGLSMNSVLKGRKELARAGIVRHEVLLRRMKDGSEKRVSHYWAQPVDEARIEAGVKRIDGRIQHERQGDRKKKGRRRAVSPQRMGPCPRKKRVHVPAGNGGKPIPSQTHEEEPLPEGDPRTRESAREGGPPAPEAPADLTGCFRCSTCALGSGWACDDREHLEREPADFGMTKAAVLTGKYSPIEVRRQLGAVRFLMEQKPAKVRKPCEHLFVAMRDRHPLPDELQPAWQRLMAVREAAREQAQAEQKAKAVEETWAPDFARLGTYLESLPGSERDELARAVAHWADNGGLSHAQRFGYAPEQSPFEGNNRRAAIRFLQVQRPDVADALGFPLVAVARRSKAQEGVGSPVMIGDEEN